MKLGFIVRVLTARHRNFVPSFFGACNRAAREFSKRAMKPFFPAAIVAASITIGATIPARAQANNPILEELRPQLQAALQKVAPDATWQLKGNELTASYKTRIYTVHSIHPDGSISAQPHQEAGPDDGGFILRVRVFSELPDFAAQTPLGGRQAYWRTYVARYNLHAGGVAVLPDAALVPTEMVGASAERIEFQDVPLTMHPLLFRLQDAGVFEMKTWGDDSRALTRNRPIVRYEVAVALAKARESWPGLSGNKAARLQALQSATQKNGVKSPQELEALDAEVQELQYEFARELTRLERQVGSVLESRPPSRIPPPRQTFQTSQSAYLVFSLSQGLTQNIVPTDVLLKSLTDLVAKSNKELDDK